MSFLGHIEYGSWQIHIIVEVIVRAAHSVHSSHSTAVVILVLVTFFPHASVLWICPVGIVVSLLMSCQVGTLSKSLVTARVVAHVRFFASVGPEMRTQVEIKRKSFEAKFTFKWFLTCMDKLMPFKLWIVKKFLSAASNRACILSLPMRHQMFPKTAAVLKDFSATQDMTRVNFVATFFPCERWRSSFFLAFYFWNLFFWGVLFFKFLSKLLAQFFIH